MGKKSNKENKTKEDHINVIKQINIISEIAKRKRNQKIL